MSTLDPMDRTAATSIDNGTHGCGRAIPGLAEVAQTTPENAPAQVRRRIRIPVQFPDGYSTTAVAISFAGLVDGREHLALQLGPAVRGQVPLVRLHSECLTGDVFGSQRCDCGPQLREGVQQIAECGGYLLYLRQEGRGIGLYDKLDAYALQDSGLDTYEANVALGHREDERDYRSAAQMLQTLAITTIHLLSNNPDKHTQLTSLGITIASMVPTGVHLNATNVDYLTAKARHGGHDLFPTALDRPPSAEDGQTGARPTKSS